MTEQSGQETIDRWHRWFAVECNNHAWDLVEKEERTPSEQRDMLYSAYAAAHHWSTIGKPINDARAEHLLARVHAVLGRADLALQYAERYLTFCQNNPCEDWDLAFAHAEMANAATVNGDATLHKKHHALAKQHGDGIKEDADREVFFAAFARIPVTCEEK
jgi:hypothetical protein